VIPKTWMAGSSPAVTHAAGSDRRRRRRPRRHLGALARGRPDSGGARAARHRRWHAGEAGDVKPTLPTSLHGTEVPSNRSIASETRCPHDVRSSLNFRHHLATPRMTQRADSVEKVGVSPWPNFFSAVGAVFRCGRGGPRHPPQTQRSESGNDTDSDTILGLESGANDYVTKPFRFAVLLARIRSQLRQHEASEDAIFAIGPFKFWPASKLLLNQEGSKLRLTEKETSILRYLYRAGERPASRERLLPRGVGLQPRSHHAHARDTHLSVKAKNRKRCRCSGHPCYCRRRLQAGALIAIS
jgi:hypothetical protein